MTGKIVVVDGRRELIVQMFNKSGGVSTAAIYSTQTKRIYIPQQRRGDER